MVSEPRAVLMRPEVDETIECKGVSSFVNAGQLPGLNEEGLGKRG